MNTLTLYALTGQYRELLSMEDSVPWEQLEQMLNDLQGDIKDKASNIAMVIGEMDALDNAFDDAITRMKARQILARNRRERIKQYLLVNMQATGIAKIEGPYHKIAIRKNPPKVIVDFEDSIPAEYMRQPVMPPPVPDKAAIGAALKAGADVPGCHLEQTERVEITS
jgi:hypothetical protein